MRRFGEQSLFREQRRGGNATVWHRRADGGEDAGVVGLEELFGWKGQGHIWKKSVPGSLDEVHGELLPTGHWEGELVCEKLRGTQIVVASI